MQNRKLKHKKIKNTGLLYEFLIRQVTSDVLKGKKPESLNLIKKYFKDKSPLKEELELYNILLNQKVKDSNFAFKIIETVLSTQNTIDKKLLERDKYNLLKEIKSKYDVDTFLKTKIGNYPVYASIYTLLEHNESEGLEEYINHKLNIANFLLTESKQVKNVENTIDEKIEPELRGLTLKLMAEKFNEKWSSLSDDQKEILRHFIHNPIDSTDSVDFIKNQTTLIEQKLSTFKKKCDDQVLKIKINEVMSILPSILKGNFITESHYLTLIRLHELINELEKIKQ